MLPHSHISSLRGASRRNRNKQQQQQQVLCEHSKSRAMQTLLVVLSHGEESNECCTKCRACSYLLAQNGTAAKVTFVLSPLLMLSRRLFPLGVCVSAGQDSAPRNNCAVTALGEYALDLFTNTHITPQTPAHRLLHFLACVLSASVLGLLTKALAVLTSCSRCRKHPSLSGPHEGCSPDESLCWMQS